MKFFRWDELQSVVDTGQIVDVSGLRPQLEAAIQMLDYETIRSRAEEWTAHEVQPPKHDPWIAAMTSGFAAGIISLVPLAIAGVQERTSQMATTWTVMLVGGCVYLWFWLEKRRYDKVYAKFYQMFIEEARRNSAKD